MRTIKEIVIEIDHSRWMAGMCREADVKDAVVRNTAWADALWWSVNGSDLDYRLLSDIRDKMMSCMEKVKSSIEAEISDEAIINTAWYNSLAWVLQDPWEGE